MSYEYGQQPATAIVPADALSSIRAGTLLDPSVILAGQLAAELPDGTTLTANNGATAGVALDRSTMVIDGVTLDKLYQLVAANHSLSVAAPASEFDVGEGSFFICVAVRGPMVGDPWNKRTASGVRLFLNSGHVFSAFVGADTVSTPHALPAGPWRILWVGLTRDAETGAPGRLYCGDGFASRAEVQLGSVAVLAANLDDAAPFMLGEMANSDIALAVLFKGAQLAGYDAAKYMVAAQALAELAISQPSQQLVGVPTMEGVTDGIDAAPSTITAAASATPTASLTAVISRPDIFATSSVNDPPYRGSSLMSIANGQILTIPPPNAGRLAYKFFVSGESSIANLDATLELVVGFGHTAPIVAGTDLFNLILKRDAAAGSRLMSWDTSVDFRLNLGPFIDITAAVNASSVPNTIITWDERNASMVRLSA